MKVFVLKVQHDLGTVYLKTVASDKQTAISNTCICEGCPEFAIYGVKEIPKSLFSMSARHLYCKQ